MYASSKPDEQGQRLIQARELTRLTRRAFSLRQGISVASMQAWEDGRYKYGISAKNATRLISALFNEGVSASLEWLLKGIGTPPKKSSQVNLETKLLKRGVDKSKLQLVELTEENHLIMKINNNFVKAIENNSLTRLKLAVKNGATAHLLKEKELYILFGKEQNTALHVAAENAGAEIISYLIELGLHPNVRNRHLDSPAHLACLVDNTKSLNALINYDANLEAGSREGATPLIWAAFKGHARSMEVLLNKFVNINNTDFYGNTAAHWAAYNNQHEALELLYKHGASLELENNNGISPIDWACKNGHKEALEILIHLCKIR